MTFAEQLKGQLDIVEVIGQYVRLKRSGAAHKFVGLCPFHSEKTPSFNVSTCPASTGRIGLWDSFLAVPRFPE